MEDHDHYDDERDGPPCPKCDGWRHVACHCGGDLCVCDNNGERECPLCYGEGVAEPARAEKYLAHQREMHEAMRKWREADLPKSEQK